MTATQVVRSVKLDPSAAPVRLSYQVDQRAEDVLWLDPVPQPFGGVRWWFRCPTCDCRRARLYAICGRLQCRDCARLVYTTQRMDRGARLQWKATKLLRQARVPPSAAWALALQGLPARPAGMHRQTFERLTTAHREALEQRELWFMGETLRRFGHLLTT